MLDSRSQPIFMPHTMQKYYQTTHYSGVFKMTSIQIQIKYVVINALFPNIPQLTMRGRFVHTL